MTGGIKSGAIVAFSFALLAFSLLGCAPRQDPCDGATIHVVPNTHGTATGWLTGFGRERNYMVNNYADHLDYAQRNKHYTLAFSEVPTAIAMREFAPVVFRDLRGALRNDRADLANAFYLETSPDLTQGETLLRMGVDSMRWQEVNFGRRPVTAWLIDANGIHRQIPEILAQIGVRQFVYGRNPPTPSSIHLWRSPSGREALAVFSDSYAHWRPLFTARTSENSSALRAAQGELARYEQATPTGAPTLWLVGAADYSRAPLQDGVLQAAMNEIAETPMGRPCFSTPTRFFKSAWQSLHRTPSAFPVYEGESLNSYNLFWFANPRFKQQYRAAESRLLAVESVAALRSLDSDFDYPSEALQRAWILLFLNSDRALLWGAGAGEPYYGGKTWSAADRFAKLDEVLSQIEAETGANAAIALTHPSGGASMAIVERPHANGAGLAGAQCDRMPNGPATCLAQFSATQMLPLSEGPATPLRPIAPPWEVFSGGVRVQFDTATGDLTGLIGASGLNAIGGASNVIVIERQPPHDQHQDYLSPPATRSEIVARDRAIGVKAWRSPLRTIVESESTMGNGRVLVVRRVSVFHDTERIDVDLSLSGVPDDSIVYVRFRLGGEIVQEMRGVPYGVVQRDLRAPTPYDDRFLMHDHRTLGVHDAIAPAVRWSAHTDQRGYGIAVFDYGSPGREVVHNQMRLMLLAASAHYRGLPNTWLDASGTTRFRYTLAPIFTANQAALARNARDLNTPILRMSGAMPALLSSANFVIESVRREGRWLEVRGVEVAGEPSFAEIAAPWRHSSAERVDALGENRQRLRAQGGGAHRRYRFAVSPQEIVTLRFGLDRSVAAAPPLTTYRDLAPRRAADDMALRDHSLVGHPPQ
jgi:Glycosyl hydrolases family 38 N-terminal domain